MAKKIVFSCMLAIICSLAMGNRFSPITLGNRFSPIDDLGNRFSKINDLGNMFSSITDFCVADLTSLIQVNGFPCLDAKLVQASHFSLSGLHLPTNTTNPAGVNFLPVTVRQLPGLNTLGISFGRFDYAPRGVVPPHTHPRGTEILIVLEGSLLAGFVTSNPDNKLVSKVLRTGDVFVFPQGLVHFQQNVGSKNAASMAFLNSENPGGSLIAQTIFGSDPPIADDILARAFQVDKATIDMIKAKF